MSEELFINHKPYVDLNLLVDDTSALNEEPSDFAMDAESESGEESDHESNIFEIIHSRFAPSRHLRNAFFLEETAVSVSGLEISV